MSQFQDNTKTPSQSANVVPKSYQQNNTNIHGFAYIFMGNKGHARTLVTVIALS